MAKCQGGDIASPYISSIKQYEILSLPAVFDMLAHSGPVPPAEAALGRALSPLGPRRPLRVGRARVQVAEQHHGRRAIAGHGGLKI